MICCRNLSHSSSLPLRVITIINGIARYVSAAAAAIFFLYTPISNTTVFFSTKFIVMWHARNYFVAMTYSVIFPFNLSLILLFWCEWQRIPFMLAVWFVFSSVKIGLAGVLFHSYLLIGLFLRMLHRPNVDTTVI